MHTKKKKSRVKYVKTQSHNVAQDNYLSDTDKKIQSHLNELAKQHDNYSQRYTDFHNLYRFKGPNIQDKNQFHHSLLRLEKTALSLVNTCKPSDKNSPLWNAYMLLHIKYGLLLSQYYLPFDDKNPLLLQSDAIKTLLGVIHELHFEHDCQFQETVYYALQALGNHYKNNKYPHNHSALLPVFAKKCSDTIFKLASLYNYYFPAQSLSCANINAMSISERQDFELLYQQVVKPLKLLHEQKQLSIEPAWMYIKANLIMCLFKMITHQSSVWYWGKAKTDLLTVNTNKINSIEFKHSFILFKTWIDDYATRSAKLFVEIDWKELKQNAKWLAELKSLFTRWIDLIHNQLNLFEKWLRNYKTLFDIQDFWVEIVDEMTNLLNTFTLIKQSFDRYLLTYPNNPLQVNLDNAFSYMDLIRQYLDLEKDKIQVCSDFKALLQEASVQQSKQLIDESEKEMALLRDKYATRLEKNKKVTINNTEEKDDSSSEEEVLPAPENISESEQLLRKAILVFKENKPEKAIFTYQLALSVAETEGDLQHQLRALDGLCVSYTYLIAPQLHVVYDVLVRRLESRVPFSYEVRQNISTTIASFVLDYDIVLSLCKKYKHLSNYI